MTRCLMNVKTKPLHTVVVNKYERLFESAFKEHGKNYSDVNEIILGKGTITFAFTRVRAQSSSSRIVIEVPNIDTALTVWHTACEPIGA